MKPHKMRWCKVFESCSKSIKNRVFVELVRLFYCLFEHKIIILEKYPKATSISEKEEDLYLYKK